MANKDILIVPLNGEIQFSGSDSIYSTLSVGNSGHLNFDAGFISNTISASNLDTPYGILFANTNTGIINDSKLVFINNRLQIEGSISASSNLEIDNDSYLNGLVGSDSYISGFNGHGWRFNPNYSAPIGGSNLNEGTLLEVDHLNVRGGMSIYELLINQIRATNGNLFVSSTGRVSSSIDNGSGNYTLYFDDSNGGGHGFASGDLIRAQKANMASLTGSNPSTGEFIYRSDLIVNTVSNTGELTATVQSTGNTPPSSGFEYVRLGNTSETNRRGSLYLTADDLYAPYLDVTDGVSNFESFNDSSSVKVRVGRIDGITSTTFGSIPSNTYGLWASGSVYLEGNINATNGYIGNWEIGNTFISSSNHNIVLNNDDEYISLGNPNDSMDKNTLVGSGVFVSGSGQMRIGNSNEYIIWDGTDLFIKSDNLIITASDIDMTTDNFNLSSSTIVVASDNGGKIKLGNNADGQTLEAYNGIFLSGSGDFVIGNSANSYITFIDDALSINSSNFSVIAGTVSASNAWFSGSLYSSDGIIAGWNISSDGIYKNNLKLTSDGQISSSNFFVSNIGNLTASNATISGSVYATDAYLQGGISASYGNIGGWTITSSSLSSSNIDINSTGIIKTTDYRSTDTEDPTGWYIGGNGNVEFNDGTFRGILNTVALVNDTVNAIGGQVIISNATVLTSNLAATETTMSVTNVNGFSVNEFITSKTYTIDGYIVEILKIEGIDTTNNELYVERGLGAPEYWYDTYQWIFANSEYGTPDNYSKGQVFVSLGVSGSGYINIDADPINNNTPYIDIWERTGTEWSSIDHKLRLGDLSGLSSDKVYGVVNPGFGLWSENVFLEGTIIANSGSIGGWNIDSDKIYKNNLTLSGSGIISSSNFYVDNIGNLTASNANIDGIISSSEGNIGHWTISSDGIFNNNLKLTPAGEISSSNFYVDNTGKVTSSNANISGSITASALLVGNKNNAYLNYADGNLHLSMSNFSASGDNVYISSSNFLLENGNISASNAWFSGNIQADTGEIGGWIIDSNKLFSADYDIVLDSTNQIIYVGVGNYNNADTNFYLGDADFSLGNRLTFSAGNLNVTGSISASSGHFTGEIVAESGRFDGTITAGNVEFGIIDTNDRGIKLDTNNYFILDNNTTPKLLVGGSNGLNYDGTDFKLGTDVEISGSLYAESGKIGGWTISDTYLQSTNVGINSADNEIWISDKPFGSTGAQLMYDTGNAEAKFFIGVDGGEYIKFDNSKIEISSSNFSIDSTGVVSASEAWFSGSIYAEDGLIGNWNVNERGLYQFNGNTGITIWSGVPSITVFSGSSTTSGISDAKRILMDGNTANLEFYKPNETSASVRIGTDIQEVNPIIPATDASGIRLENSLMVITGSFSDSYDVAHIEFPYSNTNGNFAYVIERDNSKFRLMSYKGGGGGSSYPLEISSSTDEDTSLLMQGTGLTVSTIGTHLQNGFVTINGAVDGVSLSSSADIHTSGDIYAVGDISASGDIIAQWGASDKRVKDNICPITNSLSTINSLTGYKFDWNYPEKEYIYSGSDVGLIAQELQAVLPEAVKSRQDGYLSISYDRVIPLLVNSINEQQIQINSLKNEIENIKKYLKI